MTNIYWILLLLFFQSKRQIFLLFAIRSLNFPIINPMFLSKPIDITFILLIFILHFLQYPLPLASQKLTKSILQISKPYTHSIRKSKLVRIIIILQINNIITKMNRMNRISTFFNYFFEL